MMRRLLLAGWLTILLPVGTQAQIIVDAPASATPAVESAGQPSDFTAASPGPFSPLPPNRQSASLKGAVIGAVIGAGLAIYMVSAFCEYDCTSREIKAGLLLGGFGAAFGASLLPSRRGPVASPRDPGIRVSPVISARARGVMVAARF